MTWVRYKNTNKTGLELRSRTGAKIYPRSYCDDPTIGPVGIYVAKAPVCKLEMDPVVQFINTNIAWDISNSISATSTIDTFDIEWGGATDIGDLAGQDWQTDPLTGNVQYTTIGVYTVTASVTDLLGEQSSEISITINIVDFVLLQRCYIGTTDGGLFILTPSSGPTASNTGLTGNHANFRSVRLHPAYRDLPVGQQHLWAATQDGVAYTTDGAANWTVISEATLGTPENAAGDAPAPAASDPDNIDIAFDPQDPDRVYLLRTTTTPNDRAWLYYTDDYGTTWSNEQVSV